MRLGVALALVLVGCGGILGFGDDDDPPPSSGAVDTGDAGSGDAVTTGSGTGDASATTDGASEPDAAAPCSGPCPRRVFVTKGVFNGNLGGVDGADQKCQAAADFRSMGGQWKAWVSIAGAAVKKRFEAHPVAYVTGAAPTTIANDWDGFASATHLAAILSEVHGPPVDTPLAWTGTSAAGEHIDSNCNGWTSSDALERAIAGTSDALDEKWSNAEVVACDKELHLYCVEQ